MIEFRKQGGGGRKKRKKGESFNFSQVKLKVGRGREGNLRWKNKEALHTSNRAINAMYVTHQTGL